MDEIHFNRPKGETPLIRASLAYIEAKRLQCLAFAYSEMAKVHMEAATALQKIGNDEMKAHAKASGHGDFKKSRTAA